MNHSYRSLWNHALGAWVAVPEIARTSSGGGAARTVRATSPQWEALHSPRWPRTLLALAAAACVSSGAMAQTIESLGDLKLVDYGGTPQPIPGDVPSWGPLSFHRLTVGDNLTGSLRIVEGARLDLSSAVLGNASTSTGNMVTVTGENSYWGVTSGLTVGHSGTAALNIEKGATVSTDYYGTSVVGYESSGTGTVTVMGAGSQWSAGGLTVGRSGAGTLHIQTGAKVSSNNAYLGRESSGVGTVNVMDSGSRWDAGYELTVGERGEGTLNISNGASVESISGRVSLGKESNSLGTVTVTGVGSTFSGGELAVGDSGTGILNIEAGATVTSGTGYVGGASDKTGGGTGTGTATVTGTGSKWTIGQELVVGNTGSGTLNIEAGAVVKSDSGFVGGKPYFSASGGSPGMGTGTGTVTVKGANTRWENTGALVVGNEGDGTLLIDTGATVSSAEGYLGGDPGIWLMGAGTGTGTVTVQGANSSWTNTGQLMVGYRGNGTLNIAAGGAVSSRYASVGGSAGRGGRAGQERSRSLEAAPVGAIAVICAWALMRLGRYVFKRALRWTAAPRAATDS